MLLLNTSAFTYATADVVMLIISFHEWLNGATLKIVPMLKEVGKETLQQLSLAIREFEHLFTWLTH